MKQCSEWENSNYLLWLGVPTKEWGGVWEKAKEKCGKQFITEDLEFEGEQMGIILNNMAEIV